MTADDRLDATLAAIITADTSSLCRYAQHRHAYFAAEAELREAS